jgi:LmbE family N-acetylglucosaminyl deacetylase
MDTAVALIIFNRTDTTKKVLQALRQVKPAKLLVIADAPPHNHPDDIEKCAATRKIIEQVDWNCQVIKNYSEKKFR